MLLTPVANEAGPDAREQPLPTLQLAGPDALQSPLQVELGVAARSSLYVK